MVDTEAGAYTSTGAAGPSDLVVDLHDSASLDPALSGGKASALARAADAGIPTLGGALLTTEFARELDNGVPLVGHPAVRQIFDHVGGEHRLLVARSSSVSEDQATSSAAGRYESVIGIRDFTEFESAVRAVIDSRPRAGSGDDPMAVLVQPHIEPAIGGVLFGVDPVSGRSDRVVVTAVVGRVDHLVGGRADGSRYVLDRRGRIIESVVDHARVNHRRLVRLVEFADRLAELFGGPQDIEWAIDTDGQLWLLQSRPVTSEIRGIPDGPVLGPGPVAETFPEALHPLEVDLWVPPLREAIAHALELAGAATREAIDRSPVVEVVNGFVTLDLGLTGEDEHERSLRERVNPVDKLRQLRSAWRIGRLRSALPRLADDLVDRTDHDLERIPPLHSMTDRQLVGILGRGRRALRALHGHEVLMGLLTDVGTTRMTGASVAMRILAEARTDGSDDAEILAKSPIVLALTPPRVGPLAELPPSSETPDLPPPDDGDARLGPTDAGVLREALRLRARWVQELMARAAWQLGCRLVDTGQLEHRELIRLLSLDDLIAVVTNRAVILGDIDARMPTGHGRPLPARFQLSDSGQPIPVRDTSTGGGTGAGGGKGHGPVTFDTDDPPPGSVLVVRTLSPGLGPLLGRLSGIVAETGSVLAHLAILAREAGVPTVVGYVGATEELAEGAIVDVDGDTGHVDVVREG